MKKILVSLFVLAGGCALSAGDLASLLVPVSEMKQEARPTDETADPAETSDAKGEEPATPSKKSDVFAYVGQSELLDGLRDALVARYSPEGKLLVNAVIPWKSLQVPGSDWKIEITRVSAQSILSRMTVNFRIACGDSTVGEYQIQINCRLLRDVLVATRRFNRAEELSDDDFQVQTRDVLDVAGIPVDASDNLNGMQTRGPVSEGHVLCTRDMEEKPLVRRGQIVEAVAVEGMMRISVKAVVMEDGRAGDLISVRNISSNKNIQAKILDDHTVQVYF